MDDGTPALEVGFAIDTGGSFEALAQLAAVMDTTEAKILVEATNIERATTNMVNLGAGTASITSFGNAATRDMQTAAREIAKAEKAGESLSRSLDRQAASFGKTSSEIRAMKVETAALAAEQQGLTELAERLRSQEAALYAQEFAAARQAAQAAEAAAQDKADAAARAAAAAEREAQAVRDAAYAYQMFETKAREGLAVLREQEAIDRANKLSSDQARSSAEAYAASLQREAAAVGKTTAELKQMEVEARALEAEQKGMPDVAERIRSAYADLTVAQDKHTESAGLNRTQMQMLKSAAFNSYQSLAAGMPILRVLAEQGAEVAQAFIGEGGANKAMSDAGAAGRETKAGSELAGKALDELKDKAAESAKNLADEHGVSGALGKVMEILTPTRLLMAGTAAAVVLATKAWLDYTNAVDRMTALAQGSAAVIGATGAQLEQFSEAAAAAGNISIGAARDLTVGYVQMGQIGANVLTGLVAITGKFAAATGTDAADAQKTLGAAFQDPVKGAEELTSRYGFLTLAQVEHIQKLVEQNDLYGAQQALLDGLKAPLQGAADHVNILAQAWHAVKTEASYAWDAMGKAIDRALGGGSSLDRIAELQQERVQLLASNANGAVAQIDQQIAAERAKLAQEKSAAGVAGARSDAVDALKIARGANGADEQSGLVTSLKKINDVLADTSNKAGLSAAQLQQLRAAQADYTHAVNTWLPAADKANQLAAVDAQLAAAKTPAQKQALAAQRAEIEMKGQLVSATQAQSRAQSAGGKAYAEAQKAVDSAAASAAKAAANHAAELARDAAAQEAQTTNLYALAAAYKVSDAAALVAEARVKAESKAIKDRGDVEAAVAREVRLAVAQRVSDAAKATAAAVVQTEAEKRINDQVAAGALPASRAADALRDLIALRPLETALAAAQQVGDTRGAEAARAAIADMTDAQRASNDERARSTFLDASAANDNQLEQLQLEARLIGATDAAREHSIAVLKAWQAAEAAGWDPDQALDYVQQMAGIADAASANKVATDNYNASLTKQSELLDAINEQAQAAGQGLADAFGNAGNAIGSALSALTNYGAVQAHLAEEKAAQVKAAGGDAQRLADIEKLYAVKSANAQVAAIGTIISSAKGLFKAHSAGYKVMEGAEKAYRVLQLGLAIKTAAEQIALMLGITATKVATDTTMAASDTVRSGVEQANSVATTAVKAVEAVVNAIKSLPFPANLVAGAATAAAIATLGVAIGGGFGGGKNTLPKANDGTGTVLGDASAKSESLSKSIDALKDVDTVTMTTSRDMLSALKSIDSQIGSLTTTLINAGNIGDAVGVKEKSASVFGTSKKIVASGITGGAMSLDDIVAAGAYGTDYYADVQKKHKLFGITTSTKYKTQTADDGTDIDSQFGLILKGFYGAISDAAGPLGIATSAVQAKLDAFVVNIGKIDTSGLTGTEIQEKLQAVLSAEGDRIAQAAIPGLERYQQAGEGYLQTLTRVASTVETVTNTLDKLGESTANLGIDASMGIAKQFDSLSDFTDAADSYFTSYFTQAEQAAARTAQLGKVFDSLGLAMPATLDGFRALVEAQDLTTSAGQATYATLLQLAPAFSDLKTSLEGAKSAADIASERQDLQRQILEAQGDTAAIRALDLAKLDESNRGLQEQLYAIQDAKDAADAAASLAQAWSSVGESIKTEIDRIRGLTDTDTTSSFATLLGQFNAANTAARGGDQDAAKSLPALSQSLLTAAAAAATSRQELDRVQAQTAAQLEATYTAISGLAGAAPTLSDTTVSTVAATQASSTSTAAANDDLVTEIKSLRDEVAQLRTDNNAGHATTASNTGRVAKTLDTVTQASGGEAISVATAA